MYVFCQHHVFTHISLLKIVRDFKLTRHTLFQAFDTTCLRIKRTQTWQISFIKSMLDEFLQTSQCPSMACGVENNFERYRRNALMSRIGRRQTTNGSNTLIAHWCLTEILKGLGDTRLPIGVICVVGGWW